MRPVFELSGLVLVGDIADDCSGSVKWQYKL